jgi:hypothetical protein
MMEMVWRENGDMITRPDEKALAASPGLSFFLQHPFTTSP